MKNIYYLTHCNRHGVNGGDSRDFAFFLAIQKIFNGDINVIPLYYSGLLHRMWLSFKCMMLFFYAKDCIIFIHQNTIFSVFCGKLLNYRLYSAIFFWIINLASKRNRFILEVNDLRYEQAIDFGLNFDRSGYLNIQTKLLGIKNAEFIFASDGMRNLAISRYGVVPKSAHTIINGGILVELLEDGLPANAQNWIQQNTLNCVYAGGLIQGRQILDMVNLFKNLPNASLILCGDDGEWLNEHTLPVNVKYVGCLPEKLAYQLVSKCDLGLIPYNDKLPYYNLCYPTKASFYVTAGIPFLSTRLAELMMVFEGNQFALFYSFEQWQNEIQKLNQQSIVNMKNEARKSRCQYSWDEVLLPLKDIFALHKSGT
jgi:hypothetical protein